MNIELLLGEVGQGNKNAFAALFRELQPSFVRYATGLLAGDKSAAEDAVNEAFVAIWEQAGRFSGSGSAAGWMRRIVRNKAIDWLRKQRDCPMSLDAEDHFRETASACGPNPFEQAAATSEAIQLKNALAALNLEQREAIWLCYFEDRSIREIAAIAGCPENTAKTRLFHGRRNMRLSQFLAGAFTSAEAFTS